MSTNKQNSSYEEDAEEVGKVTMPEAGEKIKVKGGTKTEYSDLMEDKKIASYQLSDPISPAEEKDLAEQIEREYQYAKMYAQPELEENLRRLKLYNNQKRDPSKVGDTLMFTVFQTVLAALYEDTLSVKWAGLELGDNDTAENLDELAEYDYELMEKAELDYDWIWNALFFGRGLVVLNGFDRRLLCPMPYVMDNLTLLRDPRATSVNGRRSSNKGAARFLGSEITMTKRDMESHPAFFNIDRLENDDGRKANKSGDFTSLLWEARQARADAGNFQEFLGAYTEEDLGENREHELLEWWTFFKGERCLVTLACDRTKIVRYQKLNIDHWPIIDRPLYPTAGDWKGTSLPDILADKQRLRAVLKNLGLDGLMADLHPMYVYDSRRIKNRADLNFGFNKAVPVEGAVDGVIAPMNKAQVNVSLIDYFMSTLDVDAQKATATPEVQQGVMPSQQRTLGELNMVQGNSSARYSLTARIFAWSEKRFWLEWYQKYKMYFDEYIDEKIIRLVGSSSPKIRSLTRDNIISPIDPDVIIVSKTISEAKRLQEQVRFERFVQLAMADPTVDSRFGLKHLASLNGLKKDVIDIMFPLTLDEMLAEDENVMINQNELPPVAAEDNHATHLHIHSSSTETNAKRAHIAAHRRALLEMKTKPSNFPGATQDQLAIANGGEQQMGANVVPGGMTGGAIQPSQAMSAPMGG